MDYTDLKQQKLDPLRTKGASGPIPEGTVYTNYGGINCNPHSHGFLPKDYAKRKTATQQGFFNNHPEIRRFIIDTMSSILIIALLHLVMKPDGNIIDFFWQTLMYAKEVLVIFWRFSIELFAAIFNISFGDTLEVMRGTIIDVFELFHDYAEWLYAYFVG